MRKKQEIENPNSCLNKAADEEMLFVLRAQDASSPKVIMHWIAKNFETASEEKLKEAFDCALAMRNHYPRKNPD